MAYQLFILLLSFGICLFFIFLFSKSNLKMKFKVALSLILIVVSVTIFRLDNLKVSFYKIFDKKTANEIIIDNGLADLVYHPDIEKYVDGKDSDDIYKEFKVLFKKGRRRYTIEDLRLWKNVMLELYSQSDEICAEVFMGKLERSQLYNYILELDSDYVEAWINLMTRSIIYEVIREEFFPPKQSEFDKAFDLLLKKVDSKLAQKMSKSYRMLNLLPDKEICAFGKFLFKKSNLLPEESEEAFLKFLIASDE